MADFGLYTALNAGVDYGQRRRDDLARFQMGEQQRRDILQQEQMNLQSQQMIAQYFNEVNASTKDFLPQDKRRFQAQAQELMKPYAEELKRYNNDPTSYLLHGGILQLQDFVNQAQTLPAYQQGVNNKSNAAQIMKDMADPTLIHNDAQWRLSDGTVKTGDPTEAMLDFQNNLTDTIPYNGVFQDKGFDTRKYQAIKMPLDQNGQPQMVPTAVLLNDKMLSSGWTQAQTAKWFKMNGGTFIDPNDPTKTVIPYGQENPLDVQYKQLRNQNLESRLSGSDKQFLSTYFGYAQYGGDPKDPKTAIGYNAASNQVWNYTGQDGKPQTTNVRVETYYTDPTRVSKYAESVGLKPVKEKGGTLNWARSWTSPRQVFLNNGTPMTLSNDDIRDLNVDTNNVYVIRDEHGQAIQALLGHFYLSADATSRNNLDWYRSHQFGGEREGYGFLYMHGGSQVPAYIPLTGNDFEQYQFNKAYGEKAGTAAGYEMQDELYNQQLNQEQNAEQQAADYISSGQ